MIVPRCLTDRRAELHQLNENLCGVDTYARVPSWAWSPTEEAKERAAQAAKECQICHGKGWYGAVSSQDERSQFTCDCRQRTLSVAGRHT